ncbi:MAG: hypothetical protein A2X86_06015 [Bdellovibrionales bacterium GWA2_49_15]|nr:MAG: hypothetical protein A2X86_06015 [Bdellovibrionales bacterium GWA2_49_15]
MKLKLLIMLLMSVSLNVSAVDVGEDQKSECIYAVQSGRSNTNAAPTGTQTPVEVVKPKTVTR